MKLVKIIFIIISSIILFGCNSKNNEINISSFLNWESPNNSFSNDPIFTSTPPNFIQTDGTGTNNPTQITFSISGTAPDNCSIGGIDNAGNFLPIFPAGTRNGKTYTDNDGFEIIQIFGCSVESTATVSVKYTIGTKTYSGTTPTITLST